MQIRFYLKQVKLSNWSGEHNESPYCLKQGQTEIIINTEDEINKICIIDSKTRLLIKFFKMSQSIPEKIFSWIFFPHKDNPKHKKVFHPFFSFTTLLVIVYNVCNFLTNKLTSPTARRLPDGLRHNVAIFLGIYYVILFISRFKVQSKSSQARVDNFFRVEVAL
jgi:hypothetical protein